MRPVLSANYVCNSHEMNAVKFSEFSHGDSAFAVLLAYLSDLNFCKFCVRMGVSTRAIESAFRMRLRAMKIASCLSIFFDHIGDVVNERSKPEMSGIAAEPVISTWAIMQDAHVFWDWAVSKLPGQTMRLAVFVIDTNLSISTLRSASCPEPAAIWAGSLIDFFPKIQDRIVKTKSIMALSAAKSAVSLTNFRWLGSKLSSAFFTIYSNATTTVGHIFSFNGVHVSSEYYTIQGAN